MQLRTLGSLLAAASLAGVLACSKSEPPSSSADPKSPDAAPAASKVDESKAGDVKGKVVFEGTVPTNAPIKMSSDAVCMREAKGAQTQEFYVVGDGGTLQNVFVHVKSGLPEITWDTPTEPVKLDQQGCRYHPHVFGVRVGQPLEITNSDPTLHNIHALPKDNEEFNTGQPVQGMKTTHTFTKKEVIVPFKCDVHGWMNAYVGVVDHPYFAVTGKDGTFSLAKLPAGTYVVEAWHEKLGAQTQNVTIGEKETKELTFTFKSTT